jgi:SAM-dependent methyltransferase
MAGEMFTEVFWDARYGSRSQLWSGAPNPRLLEYASRLRPGRALDVGCGEGADAIWLAGLGWQVTALDISTVALGRGAERAAEVGAEVARRIDWIPTDLLSWSGPEPASYELASVQFMQFPKLEREVLFRHVAASVAPGGTLLIVAHDLSDMDVSDLRTHAPDPDLFYSAAEVARLLDPVRWEIQVADALPRTANQASGQDVHVHDAVLCARRRVAARAVGESSL